MCLPECAIVSSCFGNSFVDIVLGTLAYFLVVGTVPENVLDRVSLLAVGALVRVDEFSRF